MISDLENMGKMIGSGHYEREDNEFDISIRKPESPNHDTLIVHNSNSRSNSKQNEIMGLARNGQMSRKTNSDNELNRLSGEMNQRITQDMKALMSSVSPANTEGLKRSHN